jgi:hypothetical protein
MKILSNPSRLLTAIIVSTALIIFSCKKETSDTLSPQDEEQANITASESDAEAEGVFNGVFDDIIGVNNDVGISGTGIFGRSGSLGSLSSIDARVDNVNLQPSCLHVTTSGTTFPLTITLDFGSGCTASDGHFRKGKIIITYSNRLLKPGAMATAKFEDYYIDSIHIENSTTHTITNTGTTDAWQFTIDIHAKLSKTNGNYSEWISHRVITRIERNLTSVLDDIYKITGSASGKVKRNDVIVAWKAEIINYLIKRFSCHWISAGKVRIVRENLSANSQWAGSLDYGPGNCDKIATLTVGNRTIQITLR